MNRYMIRKVVGNPQYIILTERTTGEDMCIHVDTIPELITLLSGWHDDVIREGK